MALYISNGIGVNSIEDDWAIPAGWSVIDPKDAEAKNPGLFGAPTDENGNVIKPAVVKPVKADATDK
jgi:hypothetical protein